MENRNNSEENVLQNIHRGEVLTLLLTAVALQKSREAETREGQKRTIWAVQTQVQGR